MTVTISTTPNTTNLNGSTHFKESTFSTSRLSTKAEPPSNQNGVVADLNPALAKLLGKANPITAKINGTATALLESPDSKKLNIRFQPYIYPTPGESKIYLKGRRTDSESYITIVYDPESIPVVDSMNNTRSNIRLEGISPQLLKQARLVVSEIKKEWKVALDLKKQYKEARKIYKQELKASFKYRVKNPPKERKIKVRYAPSEEKSKFRDLALEIKSKCEAHPLCNLYGRSQTVRYDSLKEVYNEKINELVFKNEVNHNLLEDKSFEALVIYLCLKTKFNPRNGFFKTLPDGFLDSNDEAISKQLETLGKYFLTDLMRIDSAEKAEQFSSWATGLKDAGLLKLGRIISSTELFKLAYPGYLDGLNPPIREHLISSSDKWHRDSPGVESRAKKACQLVILEEGVIDQDGNIDLEEFKKKDWGEIFHKKKYGLRGAIGICPFLPTTLSCIEIAVPGLIRREGKGVIPYWRFKYPHKFTGDKGLSLIDEITRYIVEEKLKLLDKHGFLSVEKFKGVSDWHAQYDSECTGCIHRSRVGNAYTALKRVYPQKFGWGFNQINPGDIRFSGMWDGLQGETLFKFRFAKSIHTIFENLKVQRVEGFTKHSVKFNPNSDFPLEISRKDFITLKNYYMANGISWLDHCLAFNLTAGLTQVAKTYSRAFELMLGKANQATGNFGNTNIHPDDVKDRNPTRTLIVSGLLADLDLTSDILSEVRDLSIKGLWKNPIINKSSIGIEGTCLEKLLAHRPQTDLLKKTDVLYLTLTASILPSLTKDPSTKENDRITALEKILTGKYVAGSKKGEFVLSGENLRYFLKILHDDIINETTINDKLKTNLKDLIKKILKSNGDTGREVLLFALEVNKKYGIRVNTLEILNLIIENLNNSISTFEMRHERIFGKLSEHFDRMLGDVTVKEKEEASEGEQYYQGLVNPPTETDKPQDEKAAIIEELAGGDEAAKEQIYEALDTLKIEEEIQETRNICEGRIDENEHILEELKEISLNNKGGRINLLRRIDEGDIVIQVQILNQLEERAKRRSSNRFDYGSLRGKTHIITGKKERISMPTNADSLYSGNPSDLIIEPSRIDTELLSLMPDWWLHKDRTREPLAVPLLYWNNTLSVAVPQNHDPSILKKLLANLKNISLEHRLVRADSWGNLLKFYQQHARTSRIDPDKPRINQFISKEEEEKVIENLALLRKATKELLAENNDSARSTITSTAL